MTYASNIERLKANANANLTARKDNLDQTIRNIEKKEEEDIDNLQKGEELLIGGGVSAFARGYTGKPFTEEGDGLIPTLYGERIARKHKEGIEASKSERARLLKQREKEIKEYTEFAAQVDSNKRIDTKLFDGKYKMLLNGGLYEKGSLYTRLSPAAQWAFAQHRIGLFNQSIQDKVWHSMSKDETPLPVPGMPGKTYTPKGVHLDDAMPMLLKENAINETIARLREESGINLYSKAALQFGGVLDDPTKEGEAAEGSESRTKRVLMAKYRKGHAIDDSQKTREKIIREAVDTGIWDWNRILTVFKGTVDNNGNLLNLKGAWKEAKTLLKLEAVNGTLKGDAWKSALKSIGEQINPLTGTPYSQSHGPQLAQLAQEIETAVREGIDTDIRNMAIAQKEVQKNFLATYQRLQRENGGEYKPGPEIFELAAQQHRAAGGVGVPQWLTNAYSTLNSDDQADIKRINEELRAGVFDPESSLVGVSPQVKALFGRKGADGTSQIDNYNNSGAGFLTNGLKPTGYYAKQLDNLTMAMFGQAGVSKNDFNWGVKGEKIRRRMELQFRSLYNQNKKFGNMSDTDAANEALNAIQAQSMVRVDGKASDYGSVLEAQGVKLTGDPLRDSPFAMDILWERSSEDIEEESEFITNTHKWVKKSWLDPALGKGSSQFLRTPKGFLPGSHTYLQQAQEYFQGHRSTVPNFYQQVADRIDGVSALELMKWQLEGQGVDWKKLNARTRPGVDEALDLPSLNRFRTAFGLEPTTCSKLGVVCSTVDLRNQGNQVATNLENIEGETGISKDAQTGDVSIPLDSPEPVTLETRPVRLQEPIIPEGYTLGEGGTVKSDTGSIFNLTNEEFWQGSYRPGDTRNIGDTVETLTETAEGNQWLSESAIQEHRLNTGTELDGTIIPEFQWLKKLNISVSNIEAKTKDVSEDIINAYGGGLEGRAKYLAAKLRYEKEGSKVSVQSLGAKDTASDPALLLLGVPSDTRPLKKGFEELSIDEHEGLDTNWFFEDKVDENWYRQFTVPSDRNTIRQWSIKLQKSGEFDPEKHYLIPQTLKGDIFGIQWEIPVKQGKPLIVPKELQSNLQSVFNAPDSPYLADSLRGYSAQLFANNVATELTT